MYGARKGPEDSDNLFRRLSEGSNSDTVLLLETSEGTSQIVYAYWIRQK